MNNHEKLLELLQNEIPGEKEKALINKIISEDKDAEIFYDYYMKLSKAVKNFSHLSIDEISDYILFKNGDQPANKNLTYLQPLFESHLQNCKKCSEEFKILNEEYHEINSFTAFKFSEAESEKQSFAKEKVNFKRKFDFSKYAFASIIIAAFLYGSLFLISKFTAPNYYNLSRVDKKTDVYITRGRITDDFQKSIKAIEENNFIEAAEFLKSDIKNHPDDETIFYSHYILGLIYLQNAEKDFIGLFPHYNIEYAKSALSNFQSAIQKNTTGNFYNINLDAYFYSAKANLILGKTDEAKNNLKIVIDNKGGKMQEAQDILNELK